MMETAMAWTVPMSTEQVLQARAEFVELNGKHPGEPLVMSQGLFDALHKLWLSVLELGTAEDAEEAFYEALVRLVRGAHDNAVYSPHGLELIELGEQWAGGRRPGEQLASMVIDHHAGPDEGAEYIVSGCTAGLVVAER